MSVQLALFARPLVLGRTKTRLAAVLGAERALSLYAAFLEDTVERVLTLRAQLPEVELVLCCAEAEPGNALRERAERWGLPIRSQVGEALGARMTHALSEGISERGAALVVGTDAPTLPLSVLRAACVSLVGDTGSPPNVAHLSRARDGSSRDELGAGTAGLQRPASGLHLPELCFVPVADGGYVVVGARGAPPSFEDVRMGTRHALADTLRVNAGRAHVRLPPWYDVDRPADLRLLRLHVRLDPRVAPHTAAQLADMEAPGRPPTDRGGAW
ncbi:MAG: DUF2064 domain-containing protein [Polyangiales bacterium]|nr:DUF2064 domain-containing protein [Myxococcales bacterium]